MDIEILINGLLAKLAERGYRVKAEYTLNDNGEVVSIKLVFIGRLD